MNLSAFFEQNPRAAVAFSGGVDSAYLLYAAKQSGCDVHAYFVKSPFQPQFELEDAMRFANEWGIPLSVLKVDVLACEKIAQNDARRCYYCKRFLFSRLLQAAKADGYSILLDGTNASDDAADRPGMQALRELSIRSPLRECGLTKADIRARSQMAGLFTHDKPAYACLATRVPTGMRITPTALAQVERAEAALFAMGFTNFRVRLLSSGGAKLQLPQAQMVQALNRRKEILAALAPEVGEVLLDLKARGD